MRLREEGIKNPALLDVMLNTPRHIFVDEALASRAYEDSSLPIGHGQTISQPYTVARMTEVLLHKAPNKVLEIGTGSGYQTAVLAQVVREVYSIERIEDLGRRARQKLTELSIRNVRLRSGDGRLGWPEGAPFDGILVTAAALDIPSALLEQLAVGGRLVIPVDDGAGQSLMLIQRQAQGFSREILEAACFVPLRPGRG